MFNYSFKEICFAVVFIFKSFKFSKIRMGPGDEMIRLALFSRNEYRWFCRLDLWCVGFRLVYAPDYYKRYNELYRSKLTEAQRSWVANFINDNIGLDSTETDQAQLYRKLCHALERKGWV